MEYPHHQSLHLQNFTVFKDAKFEFVPGINVFIGENGTGKTHLLKVLYFVQYIASKKSPRSLFSAIFQNVNDTDLVRINEPYGAMFVEGIINNFEWEMDIIDGSLLIATNALLEVNRPVFIPAADVMAHTFRFIATYDEYNIDFDYTYRDLVQLLLSPELRNGTETAPLLAMLEEVLGGTVEEKNERFYLKTKQGHFAMPMVAEGLRKVATLHQLIKNGFLRPGRVLFWDEPEANTNPKIHDEIVQVLLLLARSGVQIFLATHNYTILKELDLQATKEDKIRFFALEKDEENGTQVHPTEDYALLSPDPIAEQFDSIYDREVTKAIGRGRSSSKK